MQKDFSYVLPAMLASLNLLACIQLLMVSLSAKISVMLVWRHKHCLPIVALIQAVGCGIGMGRSHSDFRE